MKKLSIFNIQLACHHECAAVAAAVAVDAISFETLQEMKFVEAVCMETLRLHPSVPKEAKYVRNDDILPDGTHVYKGDTVVFFPWIMGRSEE